MKWFAISPFSCAMPFFIQKQTEPAKKITIQNARCHKDNFLVQILGITDRNAAELLRGYKLLTLRQALPKLSQDEAYICDLLNAEVMLQDGKIIGRFDHVLKSATPIWVIITPDNQEILFPAQTQFIIELNVEEHRIVIAPPQGLLELYLESTNA